MNISKREEERCSFLPLHLCTDITDFIAMQYAALFKFEVVKVMFTV